MRTRWILAAGAALVFVALAAVAIVDPARLFGVSGSALGSSLSVHRDAEGGSCTREGEDWSCGLDLDGSGTDITYRLTADGSGCWEAVEDRPKRLPERAISGCVGLLDYLEPEKIEE